MRIKPETFVATGRTPAGMETGTVEVRHLATVYVCKATRNPDWGHIWAHGFVGRFFNGTKYYPVAVCCVQCKDGYHETLVTFKERRNGSKAMHQVHYDPLNPCAD